MTSYKDPFTINITASPKELRDLADRMEEKAASIQPGRTCFVDFLVHSKDVIVSLYFDQERTKGRKLRRSQQFTHSPAQWRKRGTLFA